jgi:hypothetical protein
MGSYPRAAGGADDESAGSDFASNGQENCLVAGRGDDGITDRQIRTYLIVLTVPVWAPFRLLLWFPDRGAGIGKYGPTLNS